MKMMKHAAAGMAIAVAVVMMGGAADTARGATLTWDAGGTGGLTDGAGTWDSGAYWWDGLTNVSWTPGSDAVFGNGGTGDAVTLAGPTTVSSLTMNSFSGAYTLGAAGQTVTLNNGITNNASAGATTIVSPVTLGAAQSWLNNSTNLLTLAGNVADGGFLLTVGGTGDTTLSGGIAAGTGGLTKDNGGALTFTGASDYLYTGATTVNAGMLVLNSSSANGFKSATIAINNGGTVRLGASDKVVDAATVTVNSGGALDMNGFGETIAKLLGSGNVTSTAATSTLTLKNGGSYTFAGVIGGAGLSLTYYNGSGTLTLSGQSAYGGSTRIGMGGVYSDTLKLGVDDALPGGRPVTADGSGACALDLNGHNQTVGSLSLGSNNGGQQGTVRDSVSGGVLTLTGDVTLNGHNNGAGAIFVTTLDLNGATRTFSITGSNNAGSSLFVSSVIQNGGLTKAGTSAVGFLSLSGANTYAGPTVVGSGILRLDNKLALQNSPLDTSGAGTVTLNAGAGTYTLGGLNGSKNLASVITSGLVNMTTLTINPPSGQTNTYSGVIANGAMAVTKTGAGTQILSGVNTYTGPTTVSAGTLAIEGGESLADSASLWITNGATLNLAAGVNEAVSNLYLNGALAYVGTWGGSASPATFKNNTFFSGLGVLTVLDGPPGVLDGPIIIVR